MNGDARLTQAHWHLGEAARLLHELVGSRDIETAIAICKTGQFLIEKTRDVERAKRHDRNRDELRGDDTDRENELFNDPSNNRD